jgi:hypothetical protein
MPHLVKKIKTAIDSIEQKKGPFSIKCLIADNPDDILWKLVLRADWFTQGKIARLNYLAENILYGLEDDIMSQFSYIRTFEPTEDNDLLRALDRIQQNAIQGAYPRYLNEDYIIVETYLEQARLVIPLVDALPPVNYRSTAKANKRIVAEGSGKHNKKA